MPLIGQSDRFLPLYNLLRQQSPQVTYHYWSVPILHYAIIGLGSELELRGHGSSRFEEIKQQWQRVVQRAVVVVEPSLSSFFTDDGCAGDQITGPSVFAHPVQGDQQSFRFPMQQLPQPGPLLMGGFSFFAQSDVEQPVRHSATEEALWRSYPEGSMVVPWLTIVQTEQILFLTANTLVRSDDDIEEIVERFAEDYDMITTLLDNSSCSADYDPGNVDKLEIHFGFDVEHEHVTALSGTELPTGARTRGEPQPTTVNPEKSDLDKRDKGDGTEQNASLYDPSHDPSKSILEEIDTDHWVDAVRAAIADIRAGIFDKIVLARHARLRIEKPEGSTVAEAIFRLEQRFPDCTIFAAARGGDCFLGATPELLAGLKHDRVYAMCLAGSSARAKKAEEDEVFGNTLLTNEKELHEHRFVVRAITEQLRQVCSTVEHADSPRLLKLANVQHLFTPVNARSNGEATIFDIIRLLHPTPAVGGFPRRIALQYIPKYEQFERGWYAAPIGWVDQAGDGEFAVAIRSALLRDDHAVLFAGCGIVKDSDPQNELRESRLKLLPMLQSLVGGSEKRGVTL